MPGWQAGCFISFAVGLVTLTYRQADRRTGGQADRRTGGQAGRQPGRQAARQPGRQTGDQVARQPAHWVFLRGVEGLTKKG